MIHNSSVSFATFCYFGDAEKLHKPSQLKKQIESNDYPFQQAIIVYQNCDPANYEIFDEFSFNVKRVWIDGNNEIDIVLQSYGIDLNREQYRSQTDNHHTWKQHVINHLTAIQYSDSDYIVFADSDCWIRHQKDSWVKKGIEILEGDSRIFIVSPNDGANERKTRRMSQQMFLARTEEFRNADFNQPGWDGDVTKMDTMPEYAGMIEGRMEFHCRVTKQFRYVLGPEYRYWHFNRTDKNGDWQLDYEKY